METVKIDDVVVEEFKEEKPKKKVNWFGVLCCSIVGASCMYVGYRVGHDTALSEAAADKLMCWIGGYKTGIADTVKSLVDATKE